MQLFHLCSVFPSNSKTAFFSFFFLYRVTSYQWSNIENGCGEPMYYHLGICARVISNLASNEFISIFMKVLVFLPFTSFDCILISFVFVIYS